MDYIDKDTFERYVDKAFDLDVEQRNTVYHKVLEIIDNNVLSGNTSALILGASNAASEIILLFAKILDERKNELEYKAAEKNEGNITPGIKGIFRRIG
jgi:hypothetical protein